MSALDLHELVTAIKRRGRAAEAECVAPAETECVAPACEDVEKKVIEMMIAKQDMYMAIQAAAQLEDAQILAELDEDILSDVEDLAEELSEVEDLHHKMAESWSIGARAPEVAPDESAVDFNALKPVEVAAPVLDVVLHPHEPRAPMSSEEQHIKLWIEETNAGTFDEPFETVQCDLDGHKVVLSPARMQAIGIAIDGATSKEDTSLFWIQDKPAKHRDKFGHWDPVGAKWRIFTERNIVPIEQRIAPAGKGYGCDDSHHMMVSESSVFSSSDYGDKSQYKDTALAAGLPHILLQIKALGVGVELPVGSGWAINASKKVAYYTPQLRHVEVDTSICEAMGKRYVYGFFSKEPVKPLDAQATWNSTNAVWEFPIDAHHKTISNTCCDGAKCSSERARDAKNSV